MGRPWNYEEPFVDSGVGYDYVEPPKGYEGIPMFAFAVIGSSMQPNYNEGDLVFCRKGLDDAIEDGDPVFVRFGPERHSTCTFKYAFQVPGQPDVVELRPGNKKHKPIIVPKEQIVAMNLAVCRYEKFYEMS